MSQAVGQPGAPQSGGTPRVSQPLRPQDAFTALQTHLTDLQGDVAEIPFRPFSEFMSNVLFPGQEAETKDLLARLSSPSSKVIETPKVAQFRRLLKNRAFLQKFVEHGIFKRGI